jgi:hypothetical protein
VVADAVAVTSPLILTDRFDWSPTLPGAGDYAVYAKWPAADDRATDAFFWTSASSFTICTESERITSLATATTLARI